MANPKRYFFCGIGGSGMLPLALILRAGGHIVEGSDRMRDQGRTPEKFGFLTDRGIRLFPQDGSGVTSPEQIVVASAAVEDTVPDVASARRIGAPLSTRAEQLSDLFNHSPAPIAVGGTSGKSTTTGMIGWILHHAGCDPTIVNGAVMKNFVSDSVPFAGAVVGGGDAFVAEVDESDGSIALFRPKIAVLTNVALDHKPMAELRRLFRNYLETSSSLVVNVDDTETVALIDGLETDRLTTVTINGAAADFRADHVQPTPDGIAFEVIESGTGTSVPVDLKVPGTHNVANALTALGAARAYGIPLVDAARALSTFSGLQRRLEFVGTARDVTVIDDFAHNPDKISATLSTLRTFPGRLLILFQPHGFGPLRLMKGALIESFVSNMAPDDLLIMPDPVYYGGTVDRSVGSADVIEGVQAGGRQAITIADREGCGDELVARACPGDRIVVMGARDDTLTAFAHSLVDRLSPTPP